MSDDGAALIVSVGIDAGRDWGQMLLQMYKRWAERYDHTTKPIETIRSPDTGIFILGDGVYSRLRLEKGSHRLVRIPPGDTRRQTVFASVRVMPLGIERNVEEDSQSVLPVIRSYVLHPYRQVVDHITEVKTPDVEGVLDGDLDLLLPLEQKKS